MKRKLLILTIIIIVAVVIWIYPVATFTIDETWWIVRYSDQYDIKTAELLENVYGCTVLDIEGSHDFNAMGQSFIFVGGSESFAQQAPWAEVWPVLAISKPTTQPEIIYTNDGSWSNTWIDTPQGRFNTVVNGEQQHDYGYITKAYDYVLRRHIVLVIGWSAQCTASGVRILAMQATELADHSWLVYEYNGPAVNLNDWSLSAFSNYDIIASG